MNTYDNLSEGVLEDHQLLDGWRYRHYEVLSSGKVGIYLLSETFAII